MNQLSKLIVALVCALWTGSLALAAQDSDAYPVTIAHKFGETTLTEAPERIVAIGYTEQDYWFALGIAPVAVRSWYTDDTIAYLPWAADEAAGAAPEVLVMEFGNLNYEAILALQPDLISAVTAGLTQEEYELLTQIAPTVAQSGDYIDFGMPWQAITRTIGAAAGKPAEAEAQIAALEAQFEAARAANPEFAGKTLALAYNYGEARTYGYYAEQDGRTRFFTELGFVIPDMLNTLAGERFYADLSAERIDLLDQDVLVFLGLTWAQGGRDAIEADPLINQLGVYQQGRVVFVPAEYDDALQYNSVLSLAYALEGIVPELAAALPGAEAAQATEAPVALTCEPGLRPFDHAYLATEPLCIPADPQRVVAADFAALDLMYALDIAPVAHWGALLDIWYSNATPELLPSLEAFLASSQNVGDGFELNYEVMLAAEPDLILIPDYFILSDGAYEQFSAIAPTVVLADINTRGWREHTRFYGDVLGVADETAALLDAYEARLDDFRAAAGADAFASRTATLVQAVNASEVYLSFPNYRGWLPLLELGFTAPDAQIALMNSDEVGGAVDILISNERLALLESDYLFFITSGTAEESAALMAAIQSSPLWSALPAVQNGQLYFVDLAWQANNLTSAEAALDDLFRLLLESEPGTPNPFADRVTATP